MKKVQFSKDNCVFSRNTRDSMAWNGAVSHDSHEGMWGKPTKKPILFPVLIVLLGVLRPPGQSLFES